MIPQIPTTPPSNHSLLVQQQLQDVPKSPPKWPLRPGVMVHVKVDTKQNLCAARVANHNSSIINTNTNTSIISETKNDTNIPIEKSIDENQSTNDELLNFTNSNLIERILSRLRWKRENINRMNKGNDDDGDVCSSCVNGNGKVIVIDGQNNHKNILSTRRNNRRAVNLFRQTGWFGSGKSTTSSTGLVNSNRKEQHLSGIQCTDGGNDL